jgi:hypothetical protein
MTKHIDIVLAPVTGTPDHTFVEIETADGKGVKFGEWVTQNDGSRAIRFTADDCAKVFGVVASLRAALAQMTPEQRAKAAILCGTHESFTFTAGFCAEAAAYALEQEAGE